ncbi:hypothetical protein L1887_47402 [Cichorium endivia]|nr:hypothetical protein L1887_47402 [Cichorium endivia]
MCEQRLCLACVDGLLVVCGDAECHEFVVGGADEDQGEDEKAAGQRCRTEQQLFAGLPSDREALRERGRSLATATGLQSKGGESDGGDERERRYDESSLEGAFPQRESLSDAQIGHPWRGRRNHGTLLVDKVRVDEERVGERQACSRFKNESRGGRRSGLSVGSVSRLGCVDLVSSKHSPLARPEQVSPTSAVTGASMVAV